MKEDVIKLKMATVFFCGSDEDTLKRGTDDGTIRSAYIPAGTYDLTISQGYLRLVKRRLFGLQYRKLAYSIKDPMKLTTRAGSASVEIYGNSDKATIIPIPGYVRTALIRYVVHGNDIVGVEFNRDR